MKRIEKNISNRTIILAAFLLCMAVSVVMIIRIMTFDTGNVVEVDLSNMSGTMLVGDTGNRVINGNDSGYILYGPYLSLGGELCCRY